MLKYNCQKQPSCNSHYTNNLEINFKNMKNIFFVSFYLIIQIAGSEFVVSCRLHLHFMPPLCLLHSLDRNNDTHLYIIPVLLVIFNLSNLFLFLWSSTY